MQALKALVIFMGVMIVIGVAVVGVTIYNRLNRLGEGAAPAEAPADSQAVESQAATPSAAAAAAFGDVSVKLPEGCRVVEMVPAGDRLLLRLGSLPRCNRILVLDLATGSLLGNFDLAPPQ